MEPRVNQYALAVRCRRAIYTELCSTGMPRVSKHQRDLGGTTWAIRAEALRPAFTRKLGILLHALGLYESTSPRVLPATHSERAQH